MSISELLLVALVFVFLIRKQDLKLIISKAKEMQAMYYNFKADLFSKITNDNAQFNNDLEEINFYLSKIVNLGSEYQGDYSLSGVKNHYHNLIKEKINQNPEFKINNE